MTEDSSFENWAYYKKFHHRGNGVGAFVIILIGIIFLLNNYGLVPLNAWNYLWRLWPVVLILAGIHMVLGRSWLSRVISLIITLAFLALALGLALAPTNPTVSQYLNQYLPGLQEHINLPDNAPQPSPNYNDNSSVNY